VGVGGVAAARLRRVISAVSASTLSCRAFASAASLWCASSDFVNSNPRSAFQQGRHVRVRAPAGGLWGLLHEGQVLSILIRRPFVYFILNRIDISSSYHRPVTHATFYEILVEMLRALLGSLCGAHYHSRSFVYADAI
jgi:hypothetical protein